MAANESIIRIRGDASQAISEFQKLAAATVQTYQAIEKSAESFKELRSNQRAMSQVSKIARRAIKALDDTVVKSGPNFKKATADIARYSAGLKRLKQSFSGAGMRAHAFSRDLKSVGLAVRNSGKNLQFMGRSIMIGMLPFANAIRKASNFAKALEMAEIRFVKITSLTREAGGEFDQLTDKFEKLSEAFGVSRDLITDIATDFALVGMPVSQVDTLARAANELAILGSIDVGPAKDILISTVFAMRNMATLRGETLSFNDAIKQATGQMYLFNIVNNNTAMAIKDMATAIPKLVPITVQFGLTITEAAGALAAMKASGVSAAEGTVALRTGLLRLTSLTKQADEKVEGARQRLKDFNFEAGVGIETLANFGQSLLAIRTELGDAAAFDIVKNILGIRQTAKVQLFVMDMQSAENQISVVKDAMKDLGGAEVFGSQQINNMTEFARASRVPSEAMRQAANDLLKDAGRMESVTSQFLRSLIIQMSGVENAQRDSMKELETVMESDAFKMNQAKTSMKNALTEMGGLINMMIVDHILPLVRHWVDAFKAIPDGIKKVIVILGALLAAFGPILYMLAIMKMAFGQTMQIMAGAVGKFFTGFTAAGRAATLAANQEAASVVLLSNAHKLQAATASKAAIEEALLGANMAATSKVAISSAAQNAIHAASHDLDAAATAKAAMAHRANMLTNMIRSPFGAGGKALVNSIKRGRIGGAARRVGQAFKSTAGMAGPAAMRHPGQFSKGLVAHGLSRSPAPGWKYGQTKAGRAGIKARQWASPTADRWGSIGRARTKFTPGFVKDFGAGRASRKALPGGRLPKWHKLGYAQALPMGKTIPGAMGAGQIKHGATMAVKKGVGGIGAAVKKTGGGLGKMLKLFGRMLRPIKMIKSIFMSFNPWVLGFMLLLGAVAAIWITIKNNFVTFQAAAKPGLDALKEAWQGIKAALGEVIDAIFQVFNRLSFGGKKGADEGTQMGKVFGAVFKGIAFALKIVAKLFSFLATIISTAMDFATPYLNYLLGLLTGVIQIVKAIAAFVKGDFSGAWMHAKRAIGAILLGLVSMVHGVMNFIINQIVRLMDVAAGILSQIGRLPGMGWAKDLAADIEGAGAAMQDFGAHALDGIRDTIASGTGIDPEELIRIGDTDVRDFGDELGGIMGKGVAEGFEDEMEYAAPGMHQAINDAAKEGAEAAKAFADVWASAFKKFVSEVHKQLRKGMQEAVKFVKDAFDAQTDSVVSAYDAQIDAINEVIKEEQRLSKEIAYQTKRREQIRDMALRRDSYRRNRALAIYEGRIDDARSLDLKERKSKEDADQKLTNLDTKHGETLLSQQRKDTMDQINEQKRAYANLRSDMKDELDGVLTELTKFTPKNQAEWKQIVDDINAEVTKIVGDEESAGIMGKFAESYHPDMAELTTFDWDGLFATAKDTAIANMRELYEWDPGAMEADGPFSWLFDEFDKVETEFTDFETRIKGWKERLEAALLGEQMGTQYAMMMATKGLTSMGFDRGFKTDPEIEENASTLAEILYTTMMRTVGNFVGAAGGLSASEVEREQGWNPASPLYNPFGQRTEMGTPYAWSDPAAVTGYNVRDSNFDSNAVTQGWRDATGGGGVPQAAAATAGLGLDKIKEPLKARVIRMAVEAARDGIQMTVSGKGGYRNPADQIALFKSRYSRQGTNYRGGGEGDKHWDGSWWRHISGAEVGTPGRSLHERGEAVDISGPSGRKAQRWAWMKENAKDFDLWAPIAKEPWHHAREGIRNVWSLATGGLVGGLHNQSKMAMLHGGEFVMSAKATQRIGLGSLSNMNSFSKFNGPNDAGGGVTNNSSSNITIQVDTFVGQREWFEKMMSDYNIHIAPSSERARGIEKRTVGSYTERNTRSRV